VPQGPAPSEELNGSRSPFRIGFRTPEPAEETGHPSGTIPSPASSPETPADELDPASAIESEHDAMPEQDESRAGTRSTASSTEKVANPLNGVGLRDTFRNGVILASAQAHNYLTRTQAQREVGLYLADDQDAENIGDPLARIAQRREGLGQVSPDTADLMAAFMGLAGYATKQIQRQAVASKVMDRADATQTIPGDEAA
jgi:hypothetical protein